MNKQFKYIIAGGFLGAIWGIVSLFSASTCFLHWNYPSTGSLCQLIYENTIVRVFFGIPLLYFIKDGVMTVFLIFPPLVVGCIIGAGLGGLVGTVISYIRSK
jgi:hypothetical protein